MKVQEKVEHVFKEVDSHVKSYNSLKKENDLLNKEVKKLDEKNKSLQKENNLMKNFIYDLLEKLKKIFRKILFRGDYETKDMVCEQIKDIYDEKQYDNQDVYQISRGTEKQDELFEYANIPDYWKETIKKDDKTKDRDDDFDIGM